MNSFGILFSVKVVQDLGRPYQIIIRECKERFTQYFGTRNVDVRDEEAGMIVNCDINSEDVNTLRNQIDENVEVLIFSKDESGKITVTDL